MRKNLLQGYEGCIKKNKGILFFFLISTLFFLYQHQKGLSWDFSSYVLNAKYWFGDGYYFEPMRPPLVPFIIGILSFGGWKISEFIFIILTSLLFMYSTVRLAKNLKFNSNIFYAISLNAYLLSVGFTNGTELLSLSFLELFISFLIEGNVFSGFFLGLSVLSRYTTLSFFPLILFHFKQKKIIKSLLLFVGTLSVWFIYNYYKFGNLFTSIADQYASNIFYRGYSKQAPQLIHIIQVQNILIPLFIVGIVVISYKVFQVFRKEKLNSILKIVSQKKMAIIMFLLIIFSFLNYLNIPMKNPRFLFNLLLPTFYFSCIGLNYLAKKLKMNKKKIVIATLIIFVISIITNFISPHFYTGFEKPPLYGGAIDTLDTLNLSNCSVMSDSWVLLNYLERPSLPLPPTGLVEKYLQEGQILIFFNQAKEPEYIKNISYVNTLPILYANEKYFIIGSKKQCTSIKVFDAPYLNQVNIFIQRIHNYSINQNPCFILFRETLLLEKTCNFVNGNGFKKDEYRVIE